MDRLQELCTGLFRVSMISAARGQQEAKEASGILTTLRAVDDIVARNSATLSEGVRGGVDSLPATAATPPPAAMTRVLSMVIQSIAMLLQKDQYIRGSSRQREACLKVIRSSVRSLSCVGVTREGQGGGDDEEESQSSRGDGDVGSGGRSRGDTSQSLLSEDVYHSCVACCEVVMNLHATATATTGSGDAHRTTTTTTTTTTSDEEKIYSAETLLNVLGLLRRDLRREQEKETAVAAAASGKDAGNDQRTSSGGGSAALRILAELCAWQASGARVGFWISTLLAFAAEGRSIELRLACLRCVQQLFLPFEHAAIVSATCLLYTSPSPRDRG